MSSGTVQSIHRLLCLVFFPVYLLLGLLRKFEILPGDFVVIGGSLGIKFNDNSKYLYLLLQEDPKVVWLSWSPKVVKAMRTAGLRSEFIVSWRGLYVLLRAKLFFLSHSTFDLSPLFMRGVPVIQLWHGIGFKRIGLEADGWNSSDLGQRFRNTVKRLLYVIYPHFNYMYCDRLSCMGDPTHLLGAFGIGPEKVIDYGFPRLIAFSDRFWLSHEPQLSNPDLDQVKAAREAGKKVVVYMPTHRMQFSDSSSRLQADFCEAIAQDLDIFFVYKAHFIEKGNASSKVLSYRDPDPYPLLRYADAIITDYSSVMLDFLVVDRPILLFAYDLETYEANVGFNNDYKSFVPGTICRTIEELLSTLKLELEDPKRTQAKRDNCLNLFKLDEFRSQAGVRVDRFRELARNGLPSG